MNIFNNLEIIIVANKRKEILTTNFLKNIPHRIFYTNDYDIPKDLYIKDEYKYKYNNAFINGLGTYRCFRGHQDAIKSSTKDNILIFEDDAVMKNPQWIDILYKSLSLLDTHEVVSLHGRKIEKGNEINKVFNNLKVNNLDFWERKNNSELWIQGALSYLINKKTKDKIVNYIYDGFPFDMFICNYFSFCVIKDSPFYHDRKMGSLIENIRKK